MERPLDTIRSFEAAVEGTYNSRRSTFSGRPGMLKRNVQAEQLLRIVQRRRRPSTEPADATAILEVCYLGKLPLWLICMAADWGS
jgi:Uncharacterised protein (DUF2406)